MTRGNIVIIDKDESILTSVQFNGDMYPSGNGEKAIRALKHTKDLLSYRKNVYKFDDRIFGYQHEGCYSDLIEKWDDLDFSKDYYARFNSDYIYIKNLSGKTYEIIQMNKEKASIDPGEIQVYCFGIRDDGEDVIEAMSIEPDVMDKNNLEGLRWKMEQTYLKINRLQDEYKKLLKELEGEVSEYTSSEKISIYRTEQT